MKLTNENIDELLNKVSFSKSMKKDLDKGSLRGYLDAKTGDVFGNSKMEILEKIIKIQKQNKKREVSYFKLPTVDDVIKLIRSGHKVKKEYLVRTQNDPNYWLFTFDTEVYTKEKLLKIIFHEDYFEFDKEKTDLYNKNRIKGEESYKIFYKRNDKDVNLSFWSKYKNIININDR